MEKPEQVSVSLTKYEQDIVNRESSRRGILNFSGMLRQIIREWDELKGHSGNDISSSDLPGNEEVNKE